VFPLKDNTPTRRFSVLTVGLIVANMLNRPHRDYEIRQRVPVY
jgi:hypothetical protein